MRLITAVVALSILAVAAPLYGQTPAPVQHPYDLDPYKPSDAALLRQYGSTLVGQTRLLELRDLDPYKPSHAALLRDLGGGIPWWALWYPPPFSPASLMPFPTATGFTHVPAANVIVFVARQLPAADAAATATPAVEPPQPTPTSVATVPRPESNDGVWISYAGQRWISGGPSIAFDDSAFMRIGQYRDFPVFTRTGADGDVIYVPTREGMVAPYRLQR